MSICDFVNSLPAYSGPELPVIFNGREPSLLGWAKSHEGADALAISKRKSATYNSLAVTNDTQRKFYVLYG